MHVGSRLKAVKDRSTGHLRTVSFLTGSRFASFSFSKAFKTQSADQHATNGKSPLFPCHYPFALLEISCLMPLYDKIFTVLYVHFIHLRQSSSFC